MIPQTPVGIAEDSAIGASLQFVDEAHARFFDLGVLALRGGPLCMSAAMALRDRMVPFMDLSDARVGSEYIADMGGRERQEFRKRRFVPVRRFIAWAMEYAAEAGDLSGITAEPGSMYDPDCLADVMLEQARQRRGTRRHRWCVQFSAIEPHRKR